MVLVFMLVPLLKAELVAFPVDPRQIEERTCFQTSQSFSERANLRSDVAIVYGIDPGLPQRIASWRERGYRVHVMTGVSWGHYQDYLCGRFDGVNHEDEAQTDRKGAKISHGGDVYYMCPGTNYGKFLASGVQRALEAGAEAIHLEEPEFWVRAGYSEGFKREWQSYYGEAWQPPDSSPEAQWRASKLKYFLYRRALQQVFDHVQTYNRKTGRHVRCYVPTHSLLNYAHWRIVSPESSLAALNGCDGYIAQVWTGTSRTPNVYRGVLRERTFETAFLEYGAMQNLVRSTGRRVWYLNDPIEDNPTHDWTDYRTNWESTLTASLLQPEVWRYEVAPWPERIFNGKYPNRGPEARLIPSEYATELQTVMHALGDLKQSLVEWDCGTTGLGLLVSDSLMFQRGGSVGSDEHMSHVYGLALPLLKRGMPITPVQLENVGMAHYLDGFRILLLSYHGMKPLTSAVHSALSDWVHRGGALVICDDDTDPYCQVHEWWNNDGRHYRTPREHLFERLGMRPTSLPGADDAAPVHVGTGSVSWLHENPAHLATSAAGDERWIQVVRQAATAAKLRWRETQYLVLRRGPYVIVAGLDESATSSPKSLPGRWVNLFDPELRMQTNLTVKEGTRCFLYDLNSIRHTEPEVIAAACGVSSQEKKKETLSLVVEGVAETPAIILIHSTKPPRSVELAGSELAAYEYSAKEGLLWIRFTNQAFPRTLNIRF